MLYSKNIIVRNHAGLHNRQATLFVQKANAFESIIYLERGTQRVNAKSFWVSCAFVCKPASPLQFQQKESTQKLRLLN